MDVLTQEIFILWLVCINSATQARMETGAWCDFSLHGTVFAKLLQCDCKMNTEQAREARKENKKSSNHCQIQTHFFGVQICMGLSLSEMSAS